MQPNIRNSSSTLKRSQLFLLTFAVGLMLITFYMNNGQAVTTSTLTITTPLSSTTGYGEQQQHDHDHHHHDHSNNNQQPKLIETTTTIITATIPNKIIEKNNDHTTWLDPSCNKVPVTPHPICDSKSMTNLAKSYGCVTWGTHYGGQDLPTALCALDENSIVYGFGIGEDMSYDLAIASLTKGHVYIFDPTPRAIVHVESVLSVLRSRELPQQAPGSMSKSEFIVPGTRDKISEISAQYSFQEFFRIHVLESGVKAEQFVFHPWGLWDKDDTLQFNLPEKGVSGSLVGNAGSIIINAPVKSLETIMKTLGHSHVDVLKFDIEGAELRVIPGLIKFFRSRYGTDKKQWPKMILFDLDSARPHHPAYNVEGSKVVLDMLKQEGYEIFSDRDYDIVMVMKPNGF
jgi:hypothetical protein